MIVYQWRFSLAQYVDLNGAPLVGGTLEFYQAGTLVAQVPYADNLGAVPLAAVLTLDANGRASSGGVPVQLWLLGGQPYKMVLKNAVGGVVDTADNEVGINDPSVLGIAFNEWVPSGMTPAFASATSFSFGVPLGDQTSKFNVGRKLKCTLAGGTVYAYVQTAVFTLGFTTVTVELEDGSANLDGSLSEVAYGLLQGGGTAERGQSVPALRSGMMFEKVNVQVLTGQLTLTDQSEDALIANAAAAQNVVLPAQTLLPGRRLLLENSGSLAPPSQIASVVVNVINTDQPHGLVPGQWFRLSANALGTGAIPANLAAGVDYVVLTIPTTTSLTLATSWANYLTGTAQAPGAYAPAAGGQFHGQITPNHALLTVQDSAGATVLVLPPGSWAILLSQWAGPTLGFADWTIVAASPLITGQGVLSTPYGAVGQPAFLNEVQFLTKNQVFGSASVTTATDTINYPGHLIPADVATKPWWSMKFVVGSGLPAPLVAGVEFYPLWVDANNYKVALTPGGAAIDLTTAGGAGVTNTMAVKFHVPPWVQRLGPGTFTTGPGASGATGDATPAAGGGGGAGGTAKGMLPANTVTPNSTLDVVVGSSAALSATTLGSAAPVWTMTGNAGAGGLAPAGFAGGGGPGGTAAGGVENLPGGDGHSGAGNLKGGDGGASFRGGGGRGGTGGAAPGVGRAPGSGGGGGFNNTQAGVTGADGEVVIQF